MRVLRFLGAWVRNLGDFFLGFGYAAATHELKEQWKARLIVGQPGRDGSRIVGMERSKGSVRNSAGSAGRSRREGSNPSGAHPFACDPLADAIWQEIQLRNAHPRLSPEMRRSVLVRRNMEARSQADDRD